MQLSSGRAHSSRTRRRRRFFFDSVCLVCAAGRRFCILVANRRSAASTGGGAGPASLLSSSPDSAGHGSSHAAAGSGGSDGESEAEFNELGVAIEAEEAERRRAPVTPIDVLYSILNRALPLLLLLLPTAFYSVRPHNQAVAAAAAASPPSTHSPCTRLGLNSLRRTAYSGSLLPDRQPCRPRTHPCRHTCPEGTR